MTANKVYHKILGLLKEKDQNKIIFERKYLPEFLDEEDWRIADDSLPEFVPIIKGELKRRGIAIKYDGELVIAFKKPPPDIEYIV